MKIIIVFAGIKRNTLSWHQFEELANVKKIDIKVKNKFTRNHQTLTMTIKSLNIKLSSKNSKKLSNNKYLPINIFDNTSPFDNSLF